MPGKSMFNYTFSVGSSVTWRSQAQGVWKQKTGIVIEVVPAGEKPLNHTTISRRDHESYIVLVPRVAEAGKRGIHPPRPKVLKPEIYWPVRSQLKPSQEAVIVPDGFQIKLPADRELT